MIFSNKISMISSGKNISLFAEDENNLTMFIFKNLTEKKYLELSPTTRCLNSDKKFGYHMVIKINEQHYLICFDKNISVIAADE